MATDVLSPASDPKSAPDSELPNSTADPAPDVSSDAASDRDAADSSTWRILCIAFFRCHRSPLNVAIHTVTTPLCLLGFFQLLGLLHFSVPLGVAACYAALLFLLIPARAALASSIVIGGLAWGAMAIVSWQWGVAAFVVGYVGQEIAHWITGEKTLQSTYIRSSGWTTTFLQHTVLLLPLILMVASRRRQSPLRLFVARKAVLESKLNSDESRSDLDLIRKWVRDRPGEVTQSIHWWQHDLTDEAGQAFSRLSRQPELLSRIRRFHGPGYVVHPVLGMNELYVTGPPKQSTSDTVFYMGHVDGPWAVFPGARLYRCMVAASPNKEVTTHFPMGGTRYDKPEGYRLETGDAVAFDFNRELHYITRQPSEEQKEPRVNLKLHFVAFPKSVPWYGKLLDRLTTDYDIRARKLFLNTIAPDSLVQKVKTKWVLGWTKLFELAVRHIGWTNLAFTVAVAMTSWLASDWRIWIACVSFVHYFIYLGTSREREPVSFGNFLRDAVFFKTLSMGTLAVLCSLHFSNEFLMLGLVALGFSLASYSMKVLGKPRTYYSSELGFDSPKLIDHFPYGVIPHPMILGAVVAIGSMLLVPEIRQSYSWLIGGHIALYMLVLRQEIALMRERFGNDQ